MSFEWIEIETVVAVHDMQIAEHGGAFGIRDIGLIESALARPANMVNYGDPDIVDLAASYAFGLAMNHGFIDGNKRTAYVVTRLFLRLHSMDFTAIPIERVLAFEQLGKGVFSPASFSQWLRNKITRI